MYSRNGLDESQQQKLSTDIPFASVKIRLHSQGSTPAGCLPILAHGVEDYYKGQPHHRWQ